MDMSSCENVKVIKETSGCTRGGALLHFDQKSDGRIVGFSTLPCRMYDTMNFFKRQWIFVGYPTSFQSVSKATPQFTVG